MKTRCIRVKLKKNSLEQVKAWFIELNKRKNEVLETLKNEGIVVESAFLDKIGSIDYLIYYIKSPDIKRAMHIFNNSLLPIDDFYKSNWKLFCEEFEVLENILDCELL